MLAKAYLYSRLDVIGARKGGGENKSGSVCSRLRLHTAARRDPSSRLGTARAERPSTNQQIEGTNMAWEQFEHGWRRAPATAPAKGLVVLMHGVGSNARDL